MTDKEDPVGDQLWQLRQERAAEQRRRERMDTLVRPVLLGISTLALGNLLAYGMQSHNMRVIVATAIASAGVLAAAALGLWRG